MLKDIVLNRPDQPLDYLIQKLQKPKGKHIFAKFRINLPLYIVRRVFVIGPPGCNRKENALALGEYFGWSSISLGDLLKKEVSKKTEFAPAISEALRLYRYVPDHIVIELVKR